MSPVVLLVYSPYMYVFVFCARSRPRNKEIENKNNKEFHNPRRFFVYLAAYAVVSNSFAVIKQLGEVKVLLVKDV